MSDFVIEVDRVWKEYPLHRDSPGIKEFILHIDKFMKRKREGDRHFNALKNLTFRIKREECVGIIGKNGAGKSTLLSLMLGTVLPSKGTVKIMDRVTPLLELGAGLHPDLTGRENILFNGVLLGLTKNQMLSKMSSIIDFTEMEEFMDAPIRTYSSGMFLRLAFSIAIHADPKILLIDEVLAVGDEGFQMKSTEALLKLIKGGVTTVLVSHNLQAIIEICTRALWVDHGEIAAEGEPPMVIQKYRENVLSGH
jgi:lipopolysaccharide transport system ATP-binding protein